MKSPVGGVFGCPGSYLLGLPIITDNCRAKENFRKQDFDNSCRECWNAEVPYPVIAEVIGDNEKRFQILHSGGKYGKRIFKS